MTVSHISSLRPESDETLMSFLRRAQEDADYSDDGFNSLLTGGLLPDSRLVERRDFDWFSLSRFFNASPEELHALSERSFFYAMDDDGRRGHFTRRAPWVQAKGYSAHSPAAFKASPYWRKSWLGPAAVVCREHKAVLVRHCHDCGQELASMTWKRPVPVCPLCSAHLSLGPVIAASPALLEWSGQIDRRYDSLMKKRPVDRHDFELAHFAVVWRAARLLAEEWRFAQFLSHFVPWTGLGGYVDGENISQRALRHAQCVVMAHVICELDPTVVEHYWLLAEKMSDLALADQAVVLKLTEFAETFTEQKMSGAPVCGQTTMSFASWSGWKGMPKAA